MKKLNVVGAVVGAALMCAAPFSLHSSRASNASMSVALDSANAADLRIGTTVHRRVVRHSYYAGRYYRDYDPYCGGPYVGGGWNGGTYYGGPWIDLGCYAGPSIFLLRVER